MDASRAILLCLCAGLAAFSVYIQWGAPLFWPTKRDLVLNQAEITYSQLTVNLSSPADTQAIWQHSLFHPQRTWAPVPPPAKSIVRTAPDIDRLIANYALVGITGKSRNRQAVIAKKNGTTQIVRQGDRLDTLTVVLVGDTSVTLEYDGAERTLVFPAPQLINTQTRGASIHPQHPNVPVSPINRPNR